MNIEYRTSNIERRTSRKLAKYVFITVAVAIIFPAMRLCAQSTNNNNSLPSFGNFEIIINRNIFDPNRRGFHPYQPRNFSRSPDSFALVGTMSYSKGKFAFFDSSRPEYKKVLEPGATIAGYKVKDVTPKKVILEVNTNEVAMDVGTRMVNEGPGKWKLSTDMDMPSTSNSDQSTQPADLTLPAGASPAMSDALKRLMQNREQEKQQLESK